MATTDVKVTEGSGKNVAAYSITEDAETKVIQRVVLNTSAGAEITSRAIDQTTPGTTNGVQLTGAGTWVDKSGTITSGGTAQQIAASNASRRGFLIQNNSTGDLWFSTLATAVASQPSVKIASGQTFTVTAPDVPTGAISIIGATTSQAFSAREW